MDQAVSRRALGALGVGVAALSATGAIAQTGRGMTGGALAAGNWMEQVKAQHAAIDRAFQRTKESQGVAAKKRAFMDLAGLLAAHSIAEEVVLYPGIDMKVGDPQFQKASRDQQEAKVLTAKIDNALAMGDLNTANATLAQLEAAVKAHVAEEEGQYYPALMQAADARMNAKMSGDFRMWFNRARA